MLTRGILWWENGFTLLWLSIYSLRLLLHVAPVSHFVKHSFLSANAYEVTKVNQKRKDMCDSEPDVEYSSIHRVI